MPGKKEKKSKGSEEELKTNLCDVYVFANGDKYEGEYCQMIDDTIMRNGNGKHITADGIVMEGIWENDKLNGKGKIHHPSGAYYEGDMMSNMMHGHGKYVFTDQSIYNGEFYDNKIDGEGEFTDPSGQIWCGKFKIDSAEGLEFQLNM